MKYRKLGSSDLLVSEISLGSWLTYGGGVDTERAAACVNRAFDLGVNFIDTANAYAKGGAESFLGETLSHRPRDSYVLATKVYFPMSDTDQGLSRVQILKQIDASLKRLRVEYVDLYQCHRYDAATPLALFPVSPNIRCSRVKWRKRSSPYAARNKFRKLSGRRSPKAFSPGNIFRTRRPPLAPGQAAIRWGYSSGAGPNQTSCKKCRSSSQSRWKRAARSRSLRWLGYSASQMSPPRSLGPASQSRWTTMRQRPVSRLTQHCSRGLIRFWLPYSGLDEEFQSVASHGRFKGTYSEYSWISEC
jgi:hypothetical protein